MSNANTTTFIVDNGDYFVANLDNGGVRIGLRGVNCFDIPAGHARYAATVALNDSTVEDYFDDCFVAYKIAA